MPGLIAATRQWAQRRLATAFGYDAATDSKRRRSPLVQLQSEDNVLKSADRRKIVATSRDLPRNYAIAAWMIRKHLDYVSTFGFQARTPNKAFNQRLEELVTWWSRPLNFDVAARHSRQRFIRLAERHRTLDGDFFPLKLSSGKLQGIEGDRIRTPLGEVPWNVNPDDIVHGVLKTKTGKARGYCLCNRLKWVSGFKFDRIVPARHMIQHGYFDRFDQLRGIGLIAPGINTLQDTYEGLTFALTKAKVTQLFGIKFKREAEESLGDVSGGLDGDGNEDRSKYEVDFGKGIFSLDMDPGDDADFMESKHPATEFREFIAATIGIALKSIDIPYSFFNESFTNYYGNRQAWLLYEQSADRKRADNRDLLDALTAWRIKLWIIDGTLSIPRNVGETIGDIKWEWVNRGIPWIDTLKEIKADREALAGTFTSRQRIVKRRDGGDWWEIMDELDAEEERIRQSRAQMAGEDEPDDNENVDEREAEDAK